MVSRGLIRLSRCGNELFETRERVLCGVLLGQHLVNTGGILHRAGDGQLGGFVVVLEDLLIVVGFPVNEDAADDDQLLALILGNHAGFDRIGDGLGDGVLGWAEHLYGLLGTLDRDLGDHDGRRLDGQVWRQNGEQVAVSSLLIG